jgi:DNA-binding HxlR family transcriptional regulator
VETSFDHFFTEGPQRFNEIQKSVGEITPKILSKELKDLELNEVCGTQSIFYHSGNGNL